ncbi:MAG: TetR/AcrR family transcriptional regulator [Solirubrobacterales bacterium]|nr:TetR/AcrR family transcriptional regulator [Solirubrobacterales bacterium]
MAVRNRKESGTAERVLDIAERLTQMRGFSNFSYADIAAELGITKASLHYHYPGKAELGEALITRYSERFNEALAEIDRNLPDARARLAAYADLYAGVLRNERMCMCGILAAEYPTLPVAMQSEVIRFFDENERWLTKLLEDGKADETLSYRGRAADVAQGILGALEGAMLVARTYGEVARFEAAATQLLAGLTP